MASLARVKEEPADMCDVDTTHTTVGPTALCIDRAQHTRSELEAQKYYNYGNIEVNAGGRAGEVKQELDFGPVSIQQSCTTSMMMSPKEEPQSELELEQVEYYDNENIEEGTGGTAGQVKQHLDIRPVTTQQSYTVNMMSPNHKPQLNQSFCELYEPPCIKKEPCIKEEPRMREDLYIKKEPCIKEEPCIREELYIKKEPFIKKEQFIKEELSIKVEPTDVQSLHLESTGNEASFHGYRSSVRNTELNAFTSPQPLAGSSSSSLFHGTPESTSKGPENKHKTQKNQGFNKNIPNNSKIVKEHVCNFFSPKFKDVAVLKQRIKEHAIVCPFVCTECYRCFDTEVKLYFHSKQHNKEKFECDFCHKSFVRKSSLISHLQHVTCNNAMQEQYRCENYNIKGTLERKFVKSDCQNSDSKETFTIKSNRKSYKCNTCRHTCCSSLSLKKHLRIHSGEQPYKCIICPYACSRLSSLRVHLRIHTGEKPYKCTLCPYTCSQTSTLNRHLKMHSSEKQYKCTICPYTCSRISTLRVHVRIHSSEKPYKCTICPYTCNHSSSFKRHLRTHSNEKPFECTICPYKCIDNSELKRHFRIHSGEKPYKCTICPYTCRLGSSLKRHIRIHTNEKPYKCTICSYTCSVSYSLKKHLKIHAKKNPCT